MVSSDASMIVAPEAALQAGGVILEVLPDAEVVVEHGVQHAPVQVPLQRLGQHEALAQPRNGDIQRQHSLPDQHLLQNSPVIHSAGNIMLRLSGQAICSAMSQPRNDMQRTVSSTSEVKVMAAVTVPARGAPC